LRFDAFAPAKVNLFLHVGPLQPDGYHPICSLVVFADIGDRLSATPAEEPSLVIEGAFSEGLSTGGDNLVNAALARLEQVTGVAVPAFALRLDKALPVASGLGGGSSDAGAVLRLAAAFCDPQPTDAQLITAAAAVGADGPMCLLAQPAIAQGRGDELSLAPGLPEIHAVLVNPRVASPTGRVYAAFDKAGAEAQADRPPLPEAFESVEELAWVLAGCRNDLEAPARALEPLIGEALDDLRDAPETLLARMSGSGATVFALCAGAMEAAGLVERMVALRPDWWVRACRLGAPEL
jgi:4-diphosphocytidyl-2-C-methyl-D-erythritol kinase